VGIEAEDRGGESKIYSNNFLAKRYAKRYSASSKRRGSFMPSIMPRQTNRTRFSPVLEGARCMIRITQ
jgi:hypothetical protein